ncbi:MAG: hypothetical protein U0228_17645 [Myxococcaceae bacterium]
MSRRDWAWRWSVAYGPLTLTLRFERPPLLPRDWLAARHRRPYQELAPDRWSLRAPPSDHSELVLTTPNSLTWVRSYATPREISVAFDDAALAALEAGELGPFTWDLLDEDYVTPIAAGDDPASLTRYLEAPTAELDAHYRALFTPLEFDGTSAQTEEELLAQARVAIDRWHESRGPHEHLRVLKIFARPGLGTDWLRRLGRPRLLTTVTFRAP